MKYKELMEFGSEKKLKAEGKFMQKGKDYILSDGNILHFKVNTAGIKKKKGKKKKK